MSGKTLKFNNIRLKKKDFHKSKKPIDLLSVNIDQIVVSNKFKNNNKGFKHFSDYEEGEIVKPLCIILPQMSGCIKYFESGSKNMLFLIKDDVAWVKYHKTCVVVKNKLGIKFHREPVYEYRYLKAKVREFDGVMKTNFLGNNVTKENMHYTCIACITTDSVMNIECKCKYTVKKLQMSRFINTELKSDLESSDSDLDLEAKVDNELMKKLEFDSD